MKIVNMLKGNQRYNGQRSLSSDCVDDKFKFVNNTRKLNFLHPPESYKVHHTIKSDSDVGFINSKYVQPSFSVPAPKIKKELDESECKLSAHSIIGLSGKTKSSKLNSSSTAHLKRNSNWNNYHESLQRIDSSQILNNHYQKHWFSTSLEKFKLEEKSREERLEITRYELRRQLKQILKSNLGKSVFPEELAGNRSGPEPKVSTSGNAQHVAVGYDRLVPSRTCEIENCSCPALPCMNYCTVHIMHNTDQVLFAFCTAKFADNTQCSMSVFDITHELPLCKEHARKRDNYKLYQEAKPKKNRKKVRPSAMIKPQKRNKKRRKPARPQEMSPPSNSNVIVDGESLHSNLCDESADLPPEVLDLQETDGLELVSVEQSLVSHATNLLEETDISTVLSTIPAEEFSDFFSVNRSVEYEPTREETEELERALAAVDNDVKSLEKLSQSHGLLDSFLDEHTLVESLVQIPDIFHNGYSTSSCGESMVNQTSRLLPVEPHSHS